MEPVASPAESGRLWTAGFARAIIVRRTPAETPRCRLIPGHRTPRMYILITAILAVLIAGFGASFAYFCRLPELDEADGSE